MAYTELPTTWPSSPSFLRPDLPAKGGGKEVEDTIASLSIRPYIGV